MMSKSAALEYKAICDRMYNDYIFLQERAMGYDLDLIKTQLSSKLPALDVKYKIESMHDGVGLQITINVTTHLPFTESDEITEDTYKALYEIADELVFNNWMVHFHYKGE